MYITVKMYPCSGGTDTVSPGLWGSSAYFGIYLLGRYMSFASNNCRLHRPYIVRFIIFNLLFVPSTNPLDKGLTTEFSTASISFSSPTAKRDNSGISDSLYFSIANSHFPRPAGPHFPSSQGHIKRSALEIGRARGAPPCWSVLIVVVTEGYAFSISTVNPVVSLRRIPSSLP